MSSPRPPHVDINPFVDSNDSPLVNDERPVHAQEIVSRPVPNAPALRSWMPARD